VAYVVSSNITLWETTWKAKADRTGEPRIVAFAQHQVILTDYIFTFGGVLLVLATGLANAACTG
jgi:uncharacterized membrane protein